jgi:Protein of unknown function (DUF3800)
MFERRTGCQYLRAMADRYVFADEAGNFDFSRARGASRYFILTSVTVADCSVGDQLLALRRELGWRGLLLDRPPHATYDLPHVRSEILTLIATQPSDDLRIDATILNKAKASPHLRSDTALYSEAWRLHFQYLARKVLHRRHRLFVAGASLGTKRRRRIFHQNLTNVIKTHSPTSIHVVAFWPADSDPCIQIADYANWAIQRLWEQRDSSAHDQIAHLIRSEYDAWP